MMFPSKKIKIVGVLMLFKIIGCIFLLKSWTAQKQNQNPASQQIAAPAAPAAPAVQFWQKVSVSESFWNREQQRLDLTHNPNYVLYLASSSELPDWLNAAAPESDPCQPDWRVRRQIADYNLLSELFQDFLLFHHCRSFPLLINQERVCDDAPFVLLVVKTLEAHFERRQAIRETWGRAGVVANRTVATVFLLGKATPADNHPNLTYLLRHEAEVFGDILQWDFRDTFFNLTLKDVMFLDWFRSFCPDAQFVLKGDDDVFVNTPGIIDFLANLPPHKTADLFTGDVITNAGPHRDRKLKYYVPESYFVGSYPSYAGGGGFLYSGQLALRLHEVSKRVAFFPIDDVYTGMCLEKLGLVPEKHDGFRTFDIMAKHKDNPCIHRTLMVVHSRTPEEIKHIWRWIEQPELGCQ
ncbi:N-acetyllactosaminide beta-1,3-N-acetylglucosaminyltransferase 2a [Eucyclogobius newberryi]|uniref:N-acetyllactosaminide beta-1,3-N-acetylglucosaminyltransferase 2a n=1 Tax=Eucyclogobius newberryi TaxID=166745 RepID=UPI003B5BD146